MRPSQPSTALPSEWACSAAVAGARGGAHRVKLAQAGPSSGDWPPHVVVPHARPPTAWPVLQQTSFPPDPKGSCTCVETGLILSTQDEVAVSLQQKASRLQAGR